MEKKQHHESFGFRGGGCFVWLVVTDVRSTDVLFLVNQCVSDIDVVDIYEQVDEVRTTIGKR